jgi:hypothetical protein
VPCPEAVSGADGVWDNGAIRIYDAFPHITPAWRAIVFARARRDGDDEKSII